MRGVLQILSVLLTVFGVPTALLGATALLYARSAPIQPPPSLNEGPGLAGLLGLFMTILGSVSALLGYAVLAGLRRAVKPETALQWEREHKRLW